MSRLVELRYRLRLHTDSLGDRKSILLYGRDHAGESRGCHLRAHTKLIDGGTKSRYLVYTYTALRTHCTDTLHEVGDRWGCCCRRSTQSVDSRCYFLHGDSRSR